jgi:D-threonate/D-erythronate kinase
VTPAYFVIADDLTGALEAGALFAASGIACDVVISDGAMNDACAEAIVFDVEIRHSNPEHAAAVVTRLVRNARKRGIPRLYLKIDSTLRGPIGAQILSIASVWPNRPIVFAPAYPRMGRIVRSGLLYVHNVLLADTAFARDPLDPARSSRVCDKVSAPDSRRIVGIANGAQLRAALREPSVFVCDAVSDGDLAEIASVVTGQAPPCICAGSGGLLAALIAAENGIHAATGLIVNGSFNRTSFEQVASARAHMPVFEVRDDDVVPQIARALETDGWAALSTPDVPGEPGWTLAKVADAAAAVLRSAPCESLTVFGGDTATQILARLGVRLIHPVRELLPGVAVSRIAVAGRTLKLVTKAGGFGDVDVIRQIRLALSRAE